MYLRHSARYGKGIKIIHPGEYFVSVEDELIGTLLGSCIAVCLIDTEKCIAGMNHFMLPGKITDDNIFADRTARYGITAIYQLLSTLEQTGARREKLVAKIFGGGHVLESHKEITTIPDENIRLARIMMEMEDIPIVQSDVGENFTRKLMLDVKTGRVYLKKTTRQDVYDKIIEIEKEYVQRSFKNGQD